MFGKLVLYSELGLFARTEITYTVFFDGESKGTFSVGGTEELHVEKDCNLSVRIDDYDLMSNTIRLYADGTTKVDIYYSKKDQECEITVLSSAHKEKYDEPQTKSDSKQKHTASGQSQAKTNQAYVNNQNRNSDNSQQYSEQDPPSTFRKLSVVGGWVHTFVGFLLGLVLVCGVIVTLMALFDEEFEIAMIVLGSSLLGALFIYVDYIIAGRFFFAAIDKGYNDIYYLALAFFIPPYGHKLIIALPDRGNGKKNI